jgi:hypothetical protein
MKLRRIMHCELLNVTSVFTQSVGRVTTMGVTAHMDICFTLICGCLIIKL